MSDKQTTNFSYNLVRTYFEVDPDAAHPPLGCSIDLDDFQVVFDSHNKQIRINLSGQQTDRLKDWGWPHNDMESTYLYVRQAADPK
jgi:hypothetical protein